jgi:hypothetical protein
VSVLPDPTVTLPVLLKAPAVVRLRLAWRVKVPGFAAKPARASALDSLTIREAGPSIVIVAALVTILAPVNCKVPVTR